MQRRFFITTAFVAIFVRYRRLHTPYSNVFVAIHFVWFRGDAFCGGTIWTDDFVATIFVAMFPRCRLCSNRFGGGGVLVGYVMAPVLKRRVHIGHFASTAF